MNRAILVILIFLIYPLNILSQCCASSGNPIGGTLNIGQMDHHVLRIASFFRNSTGDRYMSGNDLYTGEIGILKKAMFNYLGFLGSYGLNNNITIEMETGYFINKTQVFKLNDEKLTGYGISDIVISFKPRIYYSSEKNLEISCALGPNIPLKRKLQVINGVTMPVDIQSSTGSYGLVFQLNAIKENSFRGISFLLVNRIEKYFENKQEYNFGNSYTNSFYFSKHLFFETQQLNGCTIILQMKNQIRSKNMREGVRIDATGNCSFFFTPQVNLAIKENWNVAALCDIPVYQYFNGIQLANKLSFALSINKDISIIK